MTGDTKHKLKTSFELLLLDAAVLGDCGFPSQELHDILWQVYLKGAEEYEKLISQKGGQNK